MLPSLLAKDIKTGLKQFLVSAFEPTDAHSHGIMQRFVQEEDAWLKGPYIQLGLPFSVGGAGRTFFDSFETRFPGYSHQEHAWQRLASHKDAKSTLVATGTGSGKTECFLFPLLDHCTRARAAGESGIKALIIYPMNALASDQARRIAELVATTPAFSGLRVGLYVGGQATAPGEGTVMTANAVITDRDTMRKNPPNILLTNYKMLDYLMLRPKDRQLWEKNTPTTLRYIVVDELHTFDGAQGTDLALLLRRLRARLKIPDNHLICAGTSATLGGSSDTSPLREYAKQIFGVTFDKDSVVTENRQTVGQFLEDATVDYMFVFRPDVVSQLDTSRFATPEEAVRALFPVFFHDLPAPSEVNDKSWRQSLGALLKQHQLFVNLLKVVKGGVVSYKELCEAFARNMPQATPEHITLVVDGLLVLVAWALREHGQPLVTLRVQLWVRELRRMVGKFATDPHDIKLRSERDLPGTRDGVYLPMVQCSQCRTTGWLSRLVQGSSRLSTRLDEIYNTWFSRRPEAARLYAASSVARSHVDGINEWVCVSCGTTQQRQDSCMACGHQELLKVFRVTALKQITRGNTPFTLHDDTCPACGEDNEMVLLGARNATLGSQVVESSWASVFNDDKKLIAFSDSVQDAAHRAGFFGARTYLNNVRTALAHVIDEINQPIISWEQFLADTEQRFDVPGSVLCMRPEVLVSEFIAPNMTWQHDWAEELLKRQRLPADSRLPQRVKKRFLWQAYSEFTYLSHRGRTLERIGKAVLTIPWAAVDAIAETLLPYYREQLGARGLEQRTVAQWLWGVLFHLRRRGAVMHPELRNYVGDANIFALTRTADRGQWLPKMGEFTPRPVFLTEGTQRGFDKIRGNSRQSWFDRWAEAVLGQQTLLASGMIGAFYSQALTALEQAEILIRTQHHQGDTWALSPPRLELHTQLAWVATVGSKRRLTVPRAFAEQLMGMPCLDAPESRYEVLIPEASTWWVDRCSRGDVRRVIAAEHTGLLERKERESLEARFKSKEFKPWYENLLSATPTLEMGVDIGDLSSVLLCSVPPNQASFLQRVGRAGRRDGNAMTTTLADGGSPHDLYFFAETQEMLSGEVAPPGIFLRAAEVLRRQLAAFCMDDWVATLTNPNLLPEKTSQALDAMEQVKLDRFPYVFCDYVVQHETRLFESFMNLLGSDADESIRARLLDFMQGQGENDGLRSRLLKALQELLEERRSYKRRKEEFDRLKAKLAQQPKDEATQNEIDNAIRERDKVLDLIREINSRELLNTLTDAGLIPNYAFPESGVELKSVLWRKRAPDEPGEGAYVTLSTLKYERPAQSALSEFAPENRFYANQRRVEVDQINMNLASIEDWRFCPSCHHMQDLRKEPDVHHTCPRCSDPMWPDAAQKRTLLRFKQAIANSNDTEVRIDDSTEDREPKYYTRQLMADFLPQNVRVAWRLKSSALPFGFEFISRVTFRDVNFGELAKPGETFKVADKESTRPGFRLCKFCGKVQKSPRRNGDASEQNHSFDCPKRGSEDPANNLECLYLYREFESEALRILVPYTRNGVDERVIQSFMAAVQLGLKRRFGGKVDHLRMVLQDSPGKDGGPRRYFVMLYDSVPGGTGYLHQLLSHDASTLSEVLKMALEALNTCACNADSEKDGCYRCLYQYRLGRSMEQVSRDTAKQVLSELVGSLDQLERVDTISEIYINPNFDSVLEARFIEAIKRLGGVKPLPPIKLVQDIVNGKSGFVLDVGQQRYKIEPQREVGKDDGVLVPSKPDFVIWPWSAACPRKPIAVFCDGWAYHRSSLREDARKRSAIVASGRFWVWSVTHEDVSAAIKEQLDTDLESPLVRLARHAGANAPKTIYRAQEKAFTYHSVARLLMLLATPATPNAPDPGITQMQRDALWLGFLMVPNSQTEVANCQTVLSRWAPHFPDHIAPSKQLIPSVSKDALACSQLGYWPKDVATQGMEAVPYWQAPGLVLLTELLAEEEEQLHQAWRYWLHLFNTVQTLPGMWFAVASGLEQNDYKDLVNISDAFTPKVVQSNVPDGVWTEVLSQVLQPLREGLEKLAQAGADVPLVGHELLDEKGKVVADCELVWEKSRVVILRDDQADLSAEWSSRDWSVIQLDDGLSLVGGDPWPAVVADKLSLVLNTKEL